VLSAPSFSGIGAGGAAGRRTDDDARRQAGGDRRGAFISLPNIDVPIAGWERV